MTIRTPFAAATLLAALATASPAHAQPAAPTAPLAAGAGVAVVEVIEAEGTPSERRARFELVLSSDGNGEIQTISGGAEFKVALHRRPAPGKAGGDVVGLDLRRSERRGKEMITASASLSWAVHAGQRTLVARIAPPGAARTDVAVTVY